MRSPRRVRSWTLAGLCALLALMGMLAPGAATPNAGGPKAGKANLVIGDFRFIPRGGVPPNGPDLALIGRDGKARFGFSFAVKNVGSARSDFSTAVVSVSGRRIDSVGIPGLDPGQRDGAEGAGVIETGPGFRRIKVCADVRDDVEETREAGNCKSIRFALQPRHWEVNRFTLSARDPDDVGTFTQAVAMDFNYADFVRLRGAGTLFIFVARGIVDEEISGTDSHSTDPCTYSGSGRVQRNPWGDRFPIEGILVVDDSLRAYQAFIHDKTNKGRYFVNKNCAVTGPDPTSNRIRALGTVSLGSSRSAEDDETEFDRETTPGADVLQGARVFTETTNDLFTTHYNYRWKFTADIP